jgi:Uma2 family endonuclease
MSASTTVEPRRWTEVEYLAWEERQEQKHEFVDGRPRAMAGAQAGHNRVAADILRVLGNALRGCPCEPFGSDMKVRIPNGNYRYPDVTVDCGAPADDALYAADPRVVIEVLSPSTHFIDQQDKLDDYKSVSGLSVVALFRPDAAFARVFRRNPDGWTHEDVAGLDATLALPEIDAAIPLADAYARVALGEEG